MWEENAEQWRPYFWKTLGMVVFNLFVTGPVLTWITFPKDFKIQMNFEDRPDLLTTFWQFMLFMLVEELSFYVIHRLLHTPSLYWIHKQHHEYNVTISLALVYAHPLEHIAANLITSGLGHTLLSKVYPVHIFTVLTWFIFRVI
jgi:sterol desaturase/sphingolipid hydroxylase (fatty acid hydroxylase superfamily)